MVNPKPTWSLLAGRDLSRLRRLIVLIAALAGPACAGRRTHMGQNPVDAGSGGSGGVVAKGGATGGGATGGSGGTTPGSGGAPGGSTGATGASGGTAAGGTTGGAGGGRVAGMGGVAATGGASVGGGAGSVGAGGATSSAQGPCDIYQTAGQPCAAAYSTVRRLSSTYAGPLYQVRSGSSDQNTGAGGATHEIGQTSDGFADASAVDAACAGTICTVSLLYDQSGNGNHLPVAKAGIRAGGPFAAMDDFESSATKESLMVGGHRVYSLYMEPRQGYRLPRMGAGIPSKMESQAVYMLADGTHAGVGCCWDFGNSPPIASSFNDANALFFGSGGTASGTASVGAGDGPWFMWNSSDFVWAGGATLTSNPANPSMKVKFALGFLKTTPYTPLESNQWALRVADAATAATIVTAHQSAMSRPTYAGGAVVLGVAPDNANNSWGTFYEGAILAGYPSDATELSVLQNIRAAGYGR